MPLNNHLTTLGRMLDLSVWRNGILIPLRAIPDSLSTHTQLLIVHNDDPVHVCGWMGSCTTIFYRDRYFLLCTRHQLYNVLDGRSYEDVGLLDRDGCYFYSAAGIRFFEDVNAIELHDLVVFDFTPPCLDKPYLREMFFKLDQAPNDTPSNDVIAFLVSGYPSSQQQYNVTEETRHFGLAQAKIICELASQLSQPSDSTVLRVKPISRLEYSPDGMSGGAAFVIRMVNGEAHADLAGIIVRAGAEDFYILKIGYILRIIDDAILAEPSAANSA